MFAMLRAMGRDMFQPGPAEFIQATQDPMLRLKRILSVLCSLVDIISILIFNNLWLFLTRADPGIEYRFRLD